MNNYDIQGQGVNFDLANFTSALDVGSSIERNGTNNTSSGSKIGLNIALDANYEIGGTLEWSKVRNFLGLSPLSYSPIGSNNKPMSGGFVLYPSKPNNNMMQNIYRK